MFDLLAMNSLVIVSPRHGDRNQDGISVSIQCVKKEIFWLMALRTLCNVPRFIDNRILRISDCGCPVGQALTQETEKHVQENQTKPYISYQ
jgi:hypothetical protein